MLTTNDSQSLTVVITNFVLDATAVLDPQDRLQIDLKLVRATVLIRLCTLSVSSVQSSTITLEQHFLESCFDVIALTLHRRNTESV